jgi:hypothetical protein
LALANARPVSPPASYLKAGMPYQHQVTKCPGSWLGSSCVGIPSLRRRSVGPPPSAIHGGGRLSRHPCRSAHCAPPAFSLHPSRDLCRLDFRALRSKIKSERSSGFHPNPVGDAGGHDGSEAVGQLQMSRLTYPHRPTAARAVKAPASHTGFRVQLEIWIRHVIAARLIGLWLTPDLFRLRRVT